MRNFRNYKIWQESLDLVADVYKLIALFPPEEKYGLRSQIARAAVSIPSNIAEGSSRKSEQEFIRYLEISIGSAFELETQLLIAQKLNLIPKEPVNLILQKLDQIQQQIHNLMISIQKNQSKT
ncbi:MAG: four helix bundle protein [Chlorobi bacterium]|nr:four helix bundle protein [Chlorobiota bacterium]